MLQITIHDLRGYYGQNTKLLIKRIVHTPIADSIFRFLFRF